MRNDNVSTKVQLATLFAIAITSASIAVAAFAPSSKKDTTQENPNQSLPPAAQHAQP